MRYENVSPTWLMEGRGNPFFRNSCSSDEECADAFTERVKEENGQTVYLLTDGSRLAVMLTLPGRYLIRENWIDYTIVNVITGRCGHKLAARVRERLATNPVFIVECDEDTITRLNKGELGTYKLLNAKDCVLNTRQPAVSNHPIFEWTDPEAITLTPDEQLMLEKYRSLSVEAKAAFSTLINLSSLNKAK